MSKQYRTRRKSIHLSLGENTMGENATAVEETVTVHESKKVKPVVNDGVTVEVQKVDATFGKVSGSITYPRCTATTPDGALALANSQPLMKDGPKDADGNVTEVPQTDTEKFLKYFNAGYDAAMRITARNELAVLIEGPEKQIAAVAGRIAKIRFGDDSDENVKKVRALPEFASLLALMS